METFKKVGSAAQTQYRAQTQPSLDEIRYDLCRSNSPASITLKEALNSALIKIQQPSEQSPKKNLKNTIRDTLDQAERTSGGITPTFKTIFPLAMKALFEFYLPENGRNIVAVKGNPADKVKFYIEAAPGDTKDATLTYSAPDRKGRLPVLTISAPENTLVINTQPQQTTTATTTQQTPEVDQLLQPQLLQQQLFLRELTQVQKQKTLAQSGQESQQVNRIPTAQTPPRPFSTPVQKDQGSQPRLPSISLTPSEKTPQAPLRNSSKQPSEFPANQPLNVSLSSSQNRPYTPPPSPSSRYASNYPQGVSSASPTQQLPLYARLGYPPPYPAQTSWQNLAVLPTQSPTAYGPVVPQAQMGEQAPYVIAPTNQIQGAISPGNIRK